MALSNPDFLFGIHSVALMNRTNNMPYGILKVLGSTNIDLTQARVELFGGSQPYQWSNQPGTITSSITMNVKSVDNFLYELFLGGSTVIAAAELTGNATTLTNVLGTTLKSATTGVASASVLAGAEADLKLGKAIVIAVSATTVDVYYTTDIDFLVGADASFVNDLLKITATPLTIATGADVNIPLFGLKLTGGSGAIAMTVGHTAEFQIRPINSGSSVITIGQNGANIPEFRMIMLAQKLSDGSRFEVEAERCVGGGGSIGMAEGAFSITDFNITMLYDSASNKVFTIRKIKG